MMYVFFILSICSLILYILFYWGYCRIGWQSLQIPLYMHLLGFWGSAKKTTKWFCVTWSLNKTINKEEKYVFQASRCVILDEM